MHRKVIFNVSLKTAVVELVLWAELINVNAWGSLPGCGVFVVVVVFLLEK